MQNASIKQMAYFARNAANYEGSAKVTLENWRIDLMSTHRHLFDLSVNDEEKIREQYAAFRILAVKTWIKKNPERFLREEREAMRLEDFSPYDNFSQIGTLEGEIKLSLSKGNTAIELYDRLLMQALRHALAQTSPRAISTFEDTFDTQMRLKSGSASASTADKKYEAACLQETIVILREKAERDEKTNDCRQKSETVICKQSVRSTNSRRRQVEEPSKQVSPFFSAYVLPSPTNLTHHVSTR